MNRNVTVSHAMPIDAYWSGARRTRRADPRRFNLTLCVLNLSTWMYTTVVTVGALG